GDISGVLILGASTTIAEYMLPVLLGDFKAEHPDVTVRLRVANTDGIVSQVENNEIDLGVVEAPVTNKNLVVEECRTDQLVVIVPPGHELANDPFVPLKRIGDFPFICREEGSGTREVMLERMNTSGMHASELQIAMELGSLEAIKGAVEAGMGISVISLATVQKEIKLGTLVAIKTEPPIHRPLSFVHQKQKFRMRAMDELLNFARNYCKSYHPDEV
ncbi:MAG: LysR substrate-binding domain-containing protein, partial [Gammaproteobacteria bacterium]|nr:LysR substrate-binding domain-containing protein [Gammaproteobacteria bacterium]